MTETIPNRTYSLDYISVTYSFNEKKKKKLKTPFQTKNDMPIAAKYISPALVDEQHKVRFMSLSVRHECKSQIPLKPMQPNAFHWMGKKF